ncbi:MAG: PQQ-binding-like beta-propeller repeat protein [Bryobacteraceae bacterium]
MLFCSRGACTLLVFLTGAFSLAGEDWPRFRGSDGAGVAVRTSDLPSEFGPNKNVVWKTELPPGHSSPIVVGDRIFLTAAEGGSSADAGRDKIVDKGGKLYTYCLRRSDGRVLWRREVPRPRLERFQPTNSPASPSPVVDESRVYVFFGDFGLLAYDFEGKEQWRVPLGPFNNVNGHGSSPILAGDLVVMLCDQDTDSYLLAVRRDTGREVWRTPRPEVTRSYSTPLLYRSPTGGDQIVVPGAYYLTSYSAETGEKLWWIRGMSWQPKSTPIVHDGLIYAHWWEGGGEAEAPTETPSFAETIAERDKNGDGLLTAQEYSAEARGQRAFINIDLNADTLVNEQEWENYRARRASRNVLIAVRPEGKGDLTNSPSVQWRMQKFLPNVPSPLIYMNILYLVKDGGILSSLDAASGRILKQGRLTGALGTYYSSPVAGAGKVFLISQEGKATVVRAGADWEILSVNDMEEECFATPALLDDRIYLRTRSALYCFGSLKARAKE